MIIRLATESDVTGMLEIYAPFCADSPVTFETEAPTEVEMRRRLAVTLARFPWLVAEEAGQIVGYAYAGPHHERAAYQWSVTTAVYVRSGQLRGGIGRSLYTSLFRMLTAQGFFSAFAIIALPNPASVGLHERLGFKQVGHFPGAGYKGGRWIDVGWWQLELQPKPEHPSPPRSMAELRALPPG